MEFSDLARSRRTVHTFTSQEVPKSIVEQALSVSLWAHNHRLTFPWDYTWVGPQARAKLADLSVELKSKKGPLGDVKEKAIRAKMMEPAHLIAVGIKRSDPVREQEDYATLASSLQIASLFLWEQRLGSKWSTGGAWMNERSYDILGIDADKVRLEGGFMIGAPQSLPLRPERPPLAQFLRLTE